MGFFKRLERYVSALFKLGRIARQSKQASRAVETIEPRLDALQDEVGWLPEQVEGLDGRLYALSERLDAAEEALHGAVAGARVEDLAARVEEQGEALRSGARGIEALTRRMDDLERRLDARLAERTDPLKAELDGLSGHVRELSDALARVERLSGERIEDVRGEARAAVERVEAAEPRLRAIAADQVQGARAYTDLTRRLDLLRFGHGQDERGTPPGPPPERREGLDALMDAFYNRLEDRYRGSRDDIRERLRVYLPDIRAAVGATGRPVLDLGCGRGEWVELLGSEGIAASGIDLNPVQIAEAQAAGLDVREGDAMQALAEAADGSLAAVTAHHLVEHLPFDTVTWMTREALRALAPGGVLIYETPNPRNLIVGATTFHIDPTHRRPLPAEVLTTLFDTVGYHPVEARPLHPSETLDVIVHAKRLDPWIAELMFGPQDLAVLGQRPAGS
mgnify:CR=1 FL=1